MTRILAHPDPALQRPSVPVVRPDPDLNGEITTLHRALTSFREAHSYGRAIAAPQIGVHKRIVAMNLGAGPVTLVNPEVVAASEETFVVWDDCMSVPNHVVELPRHRRISVRFEDRDGRERLWRDASGSMSELLQHEIDHLDGVLMLDRALDGDSVRPVAERDELVGAARPQHRLSLDAIAAAPQVIDPVFLGTPQFAYRPLSRELGCDLTLKVETLNPIRSFKGRGTEHFLARAVAAGEDRPLVCASAGNFGQAMAYAARRRGRDLVVYASENADPFKVERMRELGAEVRLHGRDFDAAKARARTDCRESGAWFVEDGREPRVSEGAGTIAVELLESGDVHDAVVVPLGNGALLTGIARWFKAASPATEVIGVVSAGADAMARSWRAGRPEEGGTVDTIADAIGVRVPVPEAVADMEGIVDDVVAVDDGQIATAMQLLYRHVGLVAEPAGATGVAAVVAHPDRFCDRSVATVVTGGNVAADTASRLLG